MAAQRYPDDFDGIIAGALANRHIQMHTAGVARSIELARHPEAGDPARPRRSWCRRRCMNACDTLKEGFLNNPRACTFDFSKLACTGRRRRHLPDRAAAEDRRDVLRRRQEQQGRADLLGPGARQPAAARSASAHRRARRRLRHRAHLGVPERRLRLEDVRPRSRHADHQQQDRLRGRGRSGSDASSRRAAASCCSMPAGATPASRPRTRSSTTRACCRRWARTRATSRACSWCRAWATAAAATARTRSTRSARSKRGARRASTPAQITAFNPQSGLSRPLCPYPQYAKYKGTGNLKDAANWSCVAP